MTSRPSLLSRSARELTLILILILTLLGAPARGAEPTPLQERSFGGVDGKRIAYAVGSNAGDEAVLVILPGYSDTYLLYQELIRDCRARGYTVYIMDHRGMGLSERLAPNPKIVHVERFEDYVDDAETLVGIAGKEQPDKPFLLLGHSTGGLIAAALLARDPSRFHAAVLSAPLFEMNTGWVPGVLAYAITATSALFGADASYAPGAADIDFTTYTFESNRTTHSRERFAAKRQLFADRPELFQSGPSNNWVAKVMRATWSANDLAGQITTPLLLLQAGEDTFVGLGGQARFCAKARNCTLEGFPQARHELLQEVDAVRAPLLDSVFAHFSRQ